MPALTIIPLGLAIGILISAPVGPVNIICINRTVRHGFIAGLVAGSGAIAADGLLAAIAGFGFTGIADTITHYDRLVPLLGGLILVVFGIGVMRARPPGERELKDANPISGLRAAAGTFLITMTNPGAILGMLAIFGGVVGTDLVPEGDFAAAGLLIVSVLGGALFWWTGIAALVSRIRHRFSEGTFRAINVASGVALTCFGALILLRLAWTYVF